MADQNGGYPVDISLVIDGTGSMTPVIGAVKKHALSIHSDLGAEMERKGKPLDGLRVRVIVFRDLNFEGPDFLQATPFFNLPDQTDSFASFVDTITADGGGDEPESGLEALSVAMHSDWRREGVKRRQVIVVWTDASAHPLGESGSLPSGLTGKVATDFDKLMDLWSGQDAVVDANAKRLVLFAPDAWPWSEIGNFWSETIHHASRAGEGLGDVDYATILDVVAGSV
jgi:hypothetical protein